MCKDKLWHKSNKWLDVAMRLGLSWAHHSRRFPLRIAIITVALPLTKPNIFKNLFCFNNVFFILIIQCNGVICVVLLYIGGVFVQRCYYLTSFPINIVSFPSHFTLKPCLSLHFLSLNSWLREAEVWDITGVLCFPSTLGDNN